MDRNSLAPSSILERYLVPMGIDVVLVAIVYFAALLLRFEGQVPSNHLHNYYVTIVPIGVVYVTANYFFGLYQRVWRYASSLERRDSILSRLLHRDESYCRLSSCPRTQAIAML